MRGAKSLELSCCGPEGLCLQRAVWHRAWSLWAFVSFLRNLRVKLIKEFGMGPGISTEQLQLFSECHTNCHDYLLDHWDTHWHPLWVHGRPATQEKTWTPENSVNVSAWRAHEHLGGNTDRYRKVKEAHSKQNAKSQDTFPLDWL